LLISSFVPNSYPSLPSHSFIFFSALNEGDGEEYYQEEDWEQEEEEENKEEGGDKGRGKEGRGEEGKETITPISNNDGSVMIYATSNVVEEN